MSIEFNDQRSFHYNICVLRIFAEGGSGFAGRNVFNAIQWMSALPINRSQRTLDLLTVLLKRPTELWPRLDMDAAA